MSSSRTPAPTRTAQRAARARRAAEIAAARAREQRRRRLRVATAAVTAVVVVLGGLVVAALVGVGGDDSPAAATTTATERVVRAATSVPTDVLDSVGAGTAATPPTAVDAPALVKDGKPHVLYVGAEYCPFCAAERWPLVVALSRFGTWHDLAGSESAADDVYPRTPTLSFSGARYTSDVLAFTGVETATNQRVDGRYEPLDQLSAADQRTFTAYSRPPFINGPAGSIPFLDIGGSYVLGGSQYLPDELQGLSRTEIAESLDDPTSEVAKAVDGSANVLTAAICQVTDGAPHEVCMSPGVMTAAQSLDSAGS